VAIRARFALFAAAVVSITVVVFAVVVYLLVQHNLLTEQDTAIARSGDRVWTTGQLRGQVSLRDLSATGDRSFVFGAPPDLRDSSDTFVEILDPHGSPVLSNALLYGTDPAIPSAALAGVTSGRPTWKMVEIRGVSLRLYLRSWTLPDSSVAGYLVAGKPMSQVTGQLDGLRWFLIGGSLLAVALAVGASWLLARRALRPLEAMATTAEEIGRTQDLSRRLPDDTRNDEVGRLRTSFNTMLQQLQDAYLRIQTALDAQRRFVADASHELRTPLTTIRSNADLIWRRTDIAPQDHKEAVHDIVEESERMSRLVQRLLVLARADAGQHLELAPVDLSGISRDVVRQAQAVYPNRRLELVNGSPVEATGNADALKQLLWILIDNAAKYTSEGGRIGVHLAQPAPSSIQLSVQDNGVGIPPEHLGHIFERFYRADGARSGEGAGLGLAIARWIVREHGGTVTAANNSDAGANFTVSLPGS